MEAAILFLRSTALPKSLPEATFRYLGGEAIRELKLNLRSSDYAGSTRRPIGAAAWLGLCHELVFLQSRPDNAPENFARCRRDGESRVGRVHRAELTGVPAGASASLLPPFLFRRCPPQATGRRPRRHTLVVGPIGDVLKPANGTFG
jgi:hypothetical protein